MDWGGQGKIFRFDKQVFPFGCPFVDEAKLQKVSNIWPSREAGWIFRAFLIFACWNGEDVEASRVVRANVLRKAYGHPEH